MFASNIVRLWHGSVGSMTEEEEEEANLYQYILLDACAGTPPWASKVTIKEYPQKYKTHIVWASFTVIKSKTSVSIQESNRNKKFPPHIPAVHPFHETYFCRCRKNMWLPDLYLRRAKFQIFSRVYYKHIWFSGYRFYLYFAISFLLCVDHMLIEI
jgi:hypothetical protein